MKISVQEIIGQTTPDERLDIIEQLWDSLPDGQIPVHPAVRAEVEKRLDAYRAGGVSGPIWDDGVKAKLLRRDP